MDLEWNDAKAGQYISNVGLITSNGPNGQNVMSAEWTHYLSYAPALMSVCIKPDHASHANIKESKEFGISLAASDQAMFASVCGGNTGAKVDKIKVLEELGFGFYDAETIGCLMVKGTTMNAEMKVVKEVEFGDHTMFVGEVQKITGDENASSLIYHKGKFWKVGDPMEGPPQEKRDEIAALYEKYTK